MQFVNTFDISSNELRRIENYLERKGLRLTEISKSVNGYAIAHVCLIEEPEDIEDQSEFEVIIDVNKVLCYKFSFFGYRTDGLRIYNQQRDRKLQIYKPKFHLSFIETLSGAITPDILVTYCDFIYDSRNDDGNYEGKIYATVINFSAPKNHIINAIFKFKDCLHSKNTVEVYSFDNDDYSGLLAYRLVSKWYDFDYDDEYIERRSFDGIWNTTVWCTDKLMPLEADEDIYDKADEIMDEIMEMIKAERPEENDDYYCF